MVRVEELYEIDAPNAKGLVAEEDAKTIIKSGLCKVETTIEVVMRNDYYHVSQFMKKHHIYVDDLRVSNVPYEE